MYKVGDKVRVFWEDELYPFEMNIVWSSDDEELFELENAEKTIVMQNVKRENIFEDWETDKLAKCIMKDLWEEVEKLDEDMEDEENIIFVDKNWESIAESVAGNADDRDGIDAVNEFILSLIGYYSGNRFLYSKKDEIYYLVIVR